MYEDDDEEQEVLIHVDFKSRLEDELLDNVKQFKLIGLDSDGPMLQIGDQVFKGEWKDTLGTHVFLEKDESYKPESDFFTEAEYPFYRYLYKTDKNLQMQRVFVNLKEKVEKTSEPSCSEAGESRREGLRKKERKNLGEASDSDSSIADFENMEIKQEIN